MRSALHRPPRPIGVTGARRRSVGLPGLKIWKPPSFVQRHVGVAEDDRVRVGEAGAHPREAPLGGAGVVDRADRVPSISIAVRLRQLAAQLGAVDVAVDGDHRGPSSWISAAPMPR